MKKAAFGVSWIPVNLVESFLTSKWKLLDYTSDKPPINEVARQKPEAIISFSPPPSLLESNSVKWILSPGAGVDSMDLGKIKASGIKVVNCHANSTTVAEHAWALLMTAARNILNYHNRITEMGVWPSPSHIREFNVDLKEKKMGLIGYGAIGKKIERFALVFGMQVEIFRNNPNEDQYFEYELDERAGDLDVLMVAAPLTDKTRGLVSESILEKLPSQCIVVNIARGAIIDEKALHEALKEGKIRAAGIDVWENSPYRSDDRGVKPQEFVGTPNLIISPHRAWVSSSSIAAVARKLAEELDLIAQNKLSDNIVDLDQGY